MGESKNLWGGRFTGKADEQFIKFNRSFSFDRRLFAVDVRAVPSPSAWRIGRLAAERVVESHWQEVGEWPR